MKINYHSSLRSFVLPGRLPLWANHMVAGRQPSMVFHDHEYSELTLILSGRARHLVNASVATIEAGDFFLIIRVCPCRRWIPMLCHCCNES